MFPPPPFRAIMDLPTPPDLGPLGGFKRAASLVSPCPLVPSSSSHVSSSPRWRRDFQCDVLSRAGPEWLWQAGIAAAPRCLRGLALPVQDEWGCLVALLPGLCRVRTATHTRRPAVGIPRIWPPEAVTRARSFVCLWLCGVRREAKLCQGVGFYCRGESVFTASPLISGLDWVKIAKQQSVPLGKLALFFNWFLPTKQY